MSNPKIIRRELGSAYREMASALEESGVDLGVSHHFNRAVTRVAQEFGVQPNDLKFYGEFEIGKHGEETLVKTFMGFADPSPNADEYGRILSFKEASHMRDSVPGRDVTSVSVFTR